MYCLLCCVSAVPATADGTGTEAAETRTVRVPEIEKMGRLKNGLKNGRKVEAVGAGHSSCSAAAVLLYLFLIRALTESSIRRSFAAASKTLCSSLYELLFMIK